MNSTTPKPGFSQTLDADRPHTLLTTDVQRSGSLLYRYDDTQEQVIVPNIWYNQTYQVRVASMRWTAKVQEEQAEHFKKNPYPCDLSSAAIASIVDRYLARAKRIRAEADRMASLGDPLYPVKASGMEIDYGENVFP